MFQKKLNQNTMCTHRQTLHTHAKKHTWYIYTHTFSLLYTVYLDMTSYWNLSDITKNILWSQINMKNNHTQDPSSLLPTLYNNTTMTRIRLLWIQLPVLMQSSLRRRGGCVADGFPPKLGNYTNQMSPQPIITMISCSGWTCLSHQSNNMLHVWYLCDTHDPPVTQMPESYTVTLKKNILAALWRHRRVGSYTNISTWL